MMTLLDRLIPSDLFSSPVRLVGYALFVYLNLDKEAFAILIFLMCLDSLVGAMKSVKLGEKFSFRKMIWGFCLKLCFLIIPLVVALLGKQLGYEFSIGVSVVVSVLSVSEGYSIFGNIYTTKNGIEVTQIDFVSVLLKSLRGTLEKALEKLTNQIEVRNDCELKKTKLDEK